MKRLDEVIEILEKVVKHDYVWFDENTALMTIETLTDTLQYLRMYRSDMQIYAANQKLWEDELLQKIKDFGDAKERYIARLKELDIGTLNEPLTWEQLKQMEGKPVWVEYGCDFNQKRWVIIGSFHGRKNEFQYMDVSGGYSNIFWKKDMGADEFWQAYRKEKMIPEIKGTVSCGNRPRWERRNDG